MSSRSVRWSRTAKADSCRTWRRTDFIVAESGQPRPILDFRAEADGPVKVAVLFDISGSMRVGSKAVDARQAARHILGALRPTDEAAVFSFDTRLDRVTRFHLRLGVLETALDHVEAPFGQTSMYDAVAETARVVAGRIRRRPSPQTQAVVVLTDGIDTRSRLTPDRSPHFERHRCAVYILAVMSPIDDTRRTAPANAGAAVETWPVGQAGSLSRQRSRAREHRGATDRRRTSASIRARIRGVDAAWMASARSAHAGSGSGRTRPRRLHRRRTQSEKQNADCQTPCPAKGRGALFALAHGRKPSSEDKMKKLVVAIPVLALALGGTTACATKKMVKTGRRSQRQGRDALEDGRGDPGAHPTNEGKINEVDQKAQSAGQRADAANKSAADARAAPPTRSTPAPTKSSSVQAAGIRSDPQRRQGRIQVRQGGDARPGQGRPRSARRRSSRRSRTVPTSKSKATPTTPVPRT